MYVTRCIRALLFAIVTAVCGVAQSPPSPPPPPEDQLQHHQAGNPQRDDLSVVHAPEYKPRRVFEKLFFVAEGLRWGAAVSDWETTRHFVNETSCTESAPGFSPKPSARELYGKAVPIEAAFTVADILLRRRMRHASRADRAAALVAVNFPLTLGHGFAAKVNGHCF